MAKTEIQQYQMSEIERVLRKDSVAAKLNEVIPSAIGIKKFRQLAISCVMQSDKLALCTQRSILGAVYELAQLGLPPGSPLGYAWLVPFKSTARIIIGYKGYIKLAWNSQIAMQARPVFEGDQFDWCYGTGAKFRHKPCTDASKRGKLVHAYSHIFMPNGLELLHVIGQADADHARSCSKGSGRDDSAWNTDEASMWAKTAVRRSVAMLPLSTELATVAQFDSAVDRGEKQEFTLPRELEEEIPDVPADAPNELAARLHAEGGHSDES